MTRFAVRAWLVRALTARLGLTVDVVGDPGEGADVYVANHLGWIDVLALATLVDGAFVAKREISGWPGLGALIGALGAVFVDRDVPWRVRSFLDEGELLLRTGHPIVVFPEGTSGDAAEPKPFRTGAFALAQRVPGTRIRPIHVAVTAVGGHPADLARARSVCWVGDEALWPSVVRVWRHRSVTLRVAFGAPLDADGVHRKQLAREARAVVRSLAPGRASDRLRV